MSLLRPDGDTSRTRAVRLGMAASLLLGAAVVAGILWLRPSSPSPHLSRPAQQRPSAGPGARGELYPQGGPEGWVIKTERAVKGLARQVGELEKAVSSLRRELAEQRGRVEEMERKRREEAAARAGEDLAFWRRPPSRPEPVEPSPPPRPAPPAHEPLRAVEAPAKGRAPRPSTPGVPKEGAGAERTVWLPAGSLVRARLVTGVEAPTEGPPLPVLLAASGDALGPSLARTPFQGCLLIGEAGGEAATARAQVRVYRVSCLLPDGRVLSREAMAYVAGEDGLAGIPGILRSRRGEKLFQSLLANFAAGFGQAMASRETTVTRNLQTGYTAVTVTGDALRHGLYQGVGRSAEELASWLKDYAKKLVPVVSVAAGRRVNVVFLRGLDLGEVEAYGPVSYLEDLD